MRVAIVFHKDPYAPPKGIDLVRLRAISGGLSKRGIETEIVSPGAREGMIEDVIPVRPLRALATPGRYDLVKTCYHQSIKSVDEFSGPVVSRIVRVVDEQRPQRDRGNRGELLECQELIRSRADYLALNNQENEERWRSLYGSQPKIVLVPTGCPSEIPERTKNPYEEGSRNVLFLGSLSADRMVRMMNSAAEALKGRATVHLVGMNKASMYSCDEHCSLSPNIVNHGELAENQIWDHIRYADVGLAFATGPDAFDNDVSKILNYLRGGLPALSEEPILNNHLIAETGFGKTFKHNDVRDLAEKAFALLEDPPLPKRESTMEFIARHHSWENRVDTYVDLFHTIVSEYS